MLWGAHLGIYSHLFRRNWGNRKINTLFLKNMSCILLRLGTGRSEFVRHQVSAKHNKRRTICRLQWQECPPVSSHINVQQSTDVVHSLRLCHAQYYFHNHRNVFDQKEWIGISVILQCHKSWLHLQDIPLRFTCYGCNCFCCAYIMSSIWIRSGDYVEFPTQPSGSLVMWGTEWPKFNIVVKETNFYEQWHTIP